MNASFVLTGIVKSEAALIGFTMQQSHANSVPYDYGRDKLRLIIDHRGTKRNARINNHPVVSVVIVFESTVGGA